MTNEPHTGTSVCDCSDPAQKVAVILYPSLGAPLLIGPGQKKCSLFIATASLGVANNNGARDTQDKRSQVIPMDGDSEKIAAATVARHLRLVGMKGPKPDADIQSGELTGDSKDCATAKSAIKVWRVARFDAGALIYNQKGEVFATLSPQAVKAYTESGFTGGYVYEVELELATLSVQPESGSFKSFAWMVEPTQQQKENLPTLCAASTVHSQDLLVESFLIAQVEDLRYRHQAANATSARQGKETCLLEYDVPQTAQKARTLITNSAERLAAWHPVIKLAGNEPLNLGHLSDVHINVRHNALAKSPARVIEDAQYTSLPVGSRVCNSFNALKELFDKIGAGKKPDTALLLTGDLIDFNRNIDPAQVPDGIGEQWKKFNVLNNVNTPGLYPRGQDDMLAFSLVRYAYNELLLPVFMTSGNHEAYSVPYGISPRLNEWAASMGVMEDTTDALGDSYGRDRPFTATRTVSTPRGGAHQVSTIGLKAEVGRRLVNKNKNLDIKDLKTSYLDFDGASKWSANMPNEGISADHNMTIYETTLAYGPTYGQALTGNNYKVDNYDWFYTLFTPLEDMLIALGVEPDESGPATQVIAALGWGQGENFKNIVTGAIFTSIDKQGAGILPRAPQSFSTNQLRLLGQAQRHKRTSPGASLTVASHFTIINYDEPIAYSAKPQDMRFRPASNTYTLLPGGRPGFNTVNTGTCEINQDKYFEHCVRTEGSGNAADRNDAPAVTPDTMVDWHFSGHSHRSGVYTVAWRQPASGGRVIEVTSAIDPGIQKEQKAPARQHTRFIVSSCGGPIGRQNLDHELDGWTLRPPSGSLLEPTSGVIRQVSTQRASRSAGAPLNEVPRLCVALDYMTVMKRNKDKAKETPLEFEPAELSAGGGRVPVVLSRTMAKLECIAGMRIWAFEGGTDEFEKPRPPTWHLLTPTFHADTKSPSIEFTAEDLKTLLGAIDANGGEALAQGFCEVLLKQPKVGEHDWSKDIDCTDTWMFPLSVRLGSVSFGGRSWNFLRPPEERGEVPDWDWLASMYFDKGYIPSKQAIERKGS
ncbi:hypothetical protein ABIC89_001483 [Variovorax boronicumulans]|uniref:metallophosphoesterase n=1 Tax=Variovorax boronicumulans TaxID=436515 RepID=UPI00339AF2EA